MSLSGIAPTAVAEPYAEQQRQQQRGVPFAASVTAAAESATSQGSMSKLYRRYCAEEGCKPNSAFVDYIIDRGDTCCLTSLVLRDNYMGPKGLRPVIRLMTDCQTLVDVDFSGNGATNETVEYLCSVAETHLSLTTIRLRDSPVTVIGGKRLLDMLEANQRITMVDVEGSDVLMAMQERLHFAAELNRLRAEEQAPQLIAAAAHCVPPADGVTEEESQARAQAYKDKKLYAATLNPLSTDGGGVAAIRTPIPPPSMRAVKTTERPKPPMRAPATTMRLPAKQLEALKAKYAERARLFSEINGSDASRAAYEARIELMAMEANSHSLAAEPDPQQHQEEKEAASMSVEAVKLLTDAGSEDSTSPDLEAAEKCADGEPCQTAQSGSGEHEVGDSKKAEAVVVDKDENAAESEPVHSGGSNRCEASPEDGAVAAETKASAAIALSAPPPPPPRGATSSAMAIATAAGTAAGPVATRADGPVLLISKEERFQLLFDEGCREYSHANLDAAYVAWNEALEIATEKRNGEWVAVVSTNLQRLSYELLVGEGVEQLNRNELQEAAKSFTYAMEVAVKARNAAWESAMQKALKQVQSAVFHRSYESAMGLFEQAVQLKKAQQRKQRHNHRQDTVTAEEAEVVDTEATRFVIPGTSVVVKHTQAFLDESPAMLLVRDAVATWGESTRIARRIGGNEGEELRRTVDSALTQVAAFLAQHHLDPERETAGLGWQGTSRYHYYECVLLSELWRELLAHSDQTLKHPLFGVVVSLQLGNLYMASNQLVLADQQFRQAVLVSGKVLADPLLEATGAFFSAILCCQRAMYADAEKQLLFAVRKCEEAESEADVGVTATGDGHRPAPFAASAVATGATQQQQRGKEAESAASPKSSARSRLPRSAVPAGYLQVIQTSCNSLLVLALVSTYRHPEALERLEHTLSYQYKDILTDKLRATYYSGNLTSLDEIAAISAQVRSTLVYYLTASHFTWDDDANLFRVEERLYTWVVPQSSEMRFVEVNVTKDFNTTIGALVETMRDGLHLDPEGAFTATAASTGMITTLHRHAWMQPLQVLYSILMEPVMDYIQAMTPLLRSDSSPVTIVPTGNIWSVPFHALMSTKTERFLVESTAVQLCFSAAQVAFAALSSLRVQKRDLHRDVVVVPGEEVDAAVEATLPLAFPLDAFRGQEEGAAVLEVFQTTKDAEIHAASQANPGSTITARSELLVSELPALEAVLPQARSVHFATAATTAPPFTTGAASLARAQVAVGSDAALCIPISHKAAGMLSARQVSRMELFAELIVMTNANMSFPYVAHCSTQDHVLNLVRGFFSGGAPCVLTGLWCTPDMKPSTLFTKFYEILHSNGLRRLALRTSSRKEALGTGHQHHSGGVVGAVANDDEEGGRHKAVCLAQAIRALFQEDPSLRYAPRQWAGYYCVGCDYL